MLSILLLSRGMYLSMVILIALIELTLIEFVEVVLFINVSTLLGNPKKFDEFIGLIYIVLKLVSIALTLVNVYKFFNFRYPTTHKFISWTFNSSIKSLTLGFTIVKYLSDI